MSPSTASGSAGSGPRRSSKRWATKPAAFVKGDQYMTVYKPFKPEADAAAEMAVALGRGEKLDRIATDTVNSPTTKDIPAILLTPVPVTVHNIKETLVKDGMYAIDQICTPKFQPACKEAGLTP